MERARIAVRFDLIDRSYRADEGSPLLCGALTHNRIRFERCDFCQCRPGIHVFQFKGNPFGSARWIESGFKAIGEAPEAAFGEVV